MHKISGFDMDAFMSFATDPTNLDEAFKVQTALIGSPNRTEMIQWIVKAATEDEAFMELYREKYNPRFPTIAELQAYPAGALGNAVAAHLVKNNIQLDFAGVDVSMFYLQEQTPVTYLATRGIRTHDVYHVVLGLGTTPIDEYALFSFYLAQYTSPFHMVLLAAGYLHTVLYAPEEIPEFLDLSNRYHKLGRSSRFFPGFRFEDHWQTPLKEVREMLEVSL